MENTDLGLTGFGFWLAIALIVIAFVWAFVKTRQMKHEFKLKLIEKGKDLDGDLLAKLLAADRTQPQLEPKPVVEQQRDGGYFAGLIFLLAGVGIAFSALVGTIGPFTWLRLALGLCCFAFGWWIWIGTEKEYRRRRAEEQQQRG